MATFAFDDRPITWRTALHRHGAAYRTLVLQGEPRIFPPDGTLKEIRPVGSCVSGQAGGEPHTEGGGDQDVIVYFTNRDIDGPVYEILDESHAVIATFGTPGFKAIFEAQGATGA